MVTTHKASCDLDNLILKDISERIVRAEYELEPLLVTGHGNGRCVGEPRERDAVGARNSELVLGHHRHVQLGVFPASGIAGREKNWFLRAGRSTMESWSMD